MKVFYPMRVKTFISWSPKKYEMGMGGIPALLPRAYQENISFNFTEVALNDWIMKGYSSKVNNGIWTERSAIWSLIIHVISNAKKTFSWYALFILKKYIWLLHAGFKSESVENMLYKFWDEFAKLKWPLSLFSFKCAFIFIRLYNFVPSVHSTLYLKGT